MKAQEARPHGARARRTGSRFDVEGVGRRELDFRHPESRVGADQDPTDLCRGAGGDDDRQEGPVGDLRQQDLQGEQHPAERRVEGRGDARAGAGRKQRHLLPGREADGLREGRAERGADLDDRAFPSDRRAGADRQGGRERLHHRHLPADVAVLIEDRIHHLGHAVALGFGRESLHHPDHDQAADDRGEKQEGAERARSLEDVGVVAKIEHAVERGVVEDCDQAAQDNGADAGDDPHRQRQQAERQQADAPPVAPAVLTRAGRQLRDPCGRNSVIHVGHPIGTQSRMAARLARPKGKQGLTRRGKEMMAEP